MELWNLYAAERFTVVSYNILGDKNASKHRDLYLNVPSFYLNWGRRKRVICEELTGWNPDIICLQVSFTLSPLYLAKTLFFLEKECQREEHEKNPVTIVKTSIFYYLNGSKLVVHWTFKHELKFLEICIVFLGGGQVFWSFKYYGESRISWFL